MKVALLSDIHANACALSAVLARADADEVEHILVAGDLVGYYYEPREVVRTLRERATVTVRGNHEEMLATWIAGDAQTRRQLHERYGSGFAIAADQLDETDRRWLASLPHPTEVEIAGTRVMVCHGTPESLDTYIYPDADASERAALWSEGHTLTVFGHTHYPAVWTCDGRTAVNPGSVGQPRHGTPGASWALWDTETGEIELRSEPYDWSRLAAECARTDPHLPYLADVLSRTRRP